MSKSGVFGEDKDSFLDSCAYFVHSSRWDVLPTGCLEAAARGIPLVVSEETNLGMYLNKFNTGFVYSSDGRPVQALADVLFRAERLFEQKNLYKEHCDHAKQMISEELNWDCIAKMDMEKLYMKYIPI